MASDWINHVKKHAKLMGLSYKEALQNPKIRAAYKAMSPKVKSVRRSAKRSAKRSARRSAKRSARRSVKRSARRSARRM